MTLRDTQLIRQYDAFEEERIALETLRRKDEHRANRRSRGHLFLICLIPALIIAPSMAVFAIVSMSTTQTLAPVPAIGLTINCSPAYPYPSTVPVGSSGFVLFSCPLGVPAYNALAGTDATVNVTLLEPYVDLTTFPHGSGGFVTACHDNPEARLAVNVTLHFDADGAWDYCADYENAPVEGLPLLIVSWAW